MEPVRRRAVMAADRKGGGGFSVATVSEAYRVISGLEEIIVASKKGSLFSSIIGLNNLHC